jgi:radical SAM protein with 4Fe4S-binding SPASM domain
LHGKETVKQEFLSRSVINKLLIALPSDFRGRISFHGINEPLLDPALLDTISDFRSTYRGAYLSLNTNGDTLNAVSVALFRNSGLNKLNFSVYDADGLAKFIALTKEFPTFVERSPFVYENRGGYFTDDTPVDAPCRRPMSGMQIKSSGKVVLCCSDMKSEVVLGDLAKNNLLDIFNSRPYQSMANRLEQSRLGVKPCQSCSYSGMPYGR